MTRHPLKLFTKDDWKSIEEKIGRTAQYALVVLAFFGMLAIVVLMVVK